MPRLFFESLFDSSQPSHYQRIAEMCIVRGSASWSCPFAHRRIVLHVSKKRSQVRHAMRTKCTLSKSQSRPFTNTTNPFALGRRPSRHAPYGLLSTLLSYATYCTHSVAWYWPRYCQSNRVFSSRANMPAGVSEVRCHTKDDILVVLY